MKILFIATKLPWPAVDGGRLLVANTLDSLADLGHSVTLVPGRPRSLLVALVASELGRVPFSIARHSLWRVRREVARLLAEDAYDVVHVEQLQALAQAAPAFARGVPVVFRAQNVESDLWAATADTSRFLGLLARRQARRLAAAEGEAVATADATVALTSEDARRLAALAASRGAVRVVRVPFAASLPAADEPLAGDPAVVMLGSAGWWPNRDAADWFAAAIWPAVRAALPRARLHVFGGARGPSPEGLARHPPPADSREVFAPGAVLAAPLRVGSGVRMKILEAWARGVPVVATPRAARGLEAEDGRHLLMARDAAQFVAALRRLHEERGLAAALATAGRAHLAARHDPVEVTKKLVAVYERAARGA